MKTAKEAREKTYEVRRSQAFRDSTDLILKEISGTITQGINRGMYFVSFDINRYCDPVDAIVTALEAKGYRVITTPDPESEHTKMDIHWG